MSKKTFGSSISGKGYYIALILCAAAIGISGYLYYRNTNDSPDELQQGPSQQANGSLEEDVPVVATQPTETAAITQPTQPEPTNPTTQSGKPKKTAAPVAGEAVAEYAMDCLSYNQTTRDWRVHDGIDYAAAAGTAVTAAAEGTVYTVYDDPSMGTTVVVRHTGGYMTRYASLAQEVAVAPGDPVKLGQTLGYVGTTALMESALGDHVHFSVTCNGACVDPLEFLRDS